MAQVSVQDAFRPGPPLEQWKKTTITPPTAPPLLLRDVIPTDALNINRGIPFSPGPITAARPFKMAGDRGSFDRAVECLATAIYFEAGDEPLDGQRAVAQVVLNRVRHPAFVPSVCGVVYQRSGAATGCQFSFVCDGSLRRRPSASRWRIARAIAAAALKGSVFAPVGYATHYHADYVVPFWATSLAKKKVIGRHIFYGWPQWWGTAAAFTNRPSRIEPDPRELREAAIALLVKSQAVTDEFAAGQAPAVSPDPDFELMKIIQLLAAESSAQGRAGVDDQQVRRHFSRYSDHVAVQVFRQLSAADSRFASNAFLQWLTHLPGSPQPMLADGPTRDIVNALGGTEKLIEFMSSVRDFAKQTKFDEFLQQGRSLPAGMRVKDEPRAADISLAKAVSEGQPEERRR